MREFDVFLLKETSASDAETLRALEGQEWEIGEITSGIRRVRKEFRDSEEAESELRAILGPEVEVSHLTSGPEVGEVLGKVLERGWRPEAPVVVIQPRDHRDSDPAQATTTPSTSADGDDVKGGQTTASPPAEPSAAPADERAAIFEEGLKAIRAPAPHWDDVKAEKLGKAILEQLYADRGIFTRAAAWAVAPEVELLARVENDDAPDLATEMLKIRSGLTTEQVDVRKQEVALRVEDVHLKQKSVAQQEQAVQLLGAFRQQVDKWTSLADVGIGLLIVTLVFGMAMSAWVIYLAAADKLDDWAVPTAIFALAVFIASPAVLLLRERPLKGIDQWTPSGAAREEAAQEPGSDTDSTTEKAKSGARSPDQVTRAD
jgi:hypothetical protein